MNFNDFDKIFVKIRFNKIYMGCYTSFKFIKSLQNRNTESICLELLLTLESLEHLV